MRRNTPPPRILIAVFGSFVGAISILSALTPSLASRSDLVEGVLPPGFPEAARWTTLAIGLALLWLARSLAHGKRRAWQLAVVLVAGAAVAHLAKGLDAEEAVASLLLVALLVRYRRHFDVPGDPETKPLALTAVALGALVVALIVYELHEGLLPEDLFDLATATAALLAFRTLYLWLRSWRRRESPSEQDRQRAHELVHEHGRDSLAYFSLRQDKSYFFSESRGTFLAYTVLGGAALISGDPVGQADEVPELLASFRVMAHGRGWRVAILGASESLLPSYRRAGFHAIKIGDEGIVQPDRFSLEGRPIRKVRHSVNRLRRAGYRTTVVRETELGPMGRAELVRVSREWLGRWPERGFSMAMDDLFGHAGTLFVVARDADGRARGFLHLVPSPASGGYSLSAMRRCRDTPNGLMEFLIAETIGRLRDEGASELSLNFCVFADLLRAGERSLPGRVARSGLQSLDRVFQLGRLLSFTGKFMPEWRARFLCVERLSDVPAVGLAYLRAESLLTPPSLRRAA